MSLVFYILADIIHIIKLVLIGSIFFKFQLRIQKKNIFLYIVVILVMLSASVLIFFIENSFLKLVVYLVSVVGMFLAIYREQIVKLVFFSMWSSFVVSLLDTMSMTLVGILLDVSRLNITMLEDVVVSCISLLVVSFLSYIFNKKTKVGIKHITYKELIAFTIVAVIDAFVAVLISSFIEEQSIDKYSYLLALSMVVIGIYVQLAFVIVLFTHKIMLIEQKQVIEKYLDAQENHYEYLKNKERDTKKFRHDLRSHMQIINEMIKQGKLDLVEKYFEEINEKVEALENKVTVYNEIVDAIINQYYSIAFCKGITMEVVGKFPVKCNISTYDLCTIFSNILINAIEAAQKSDDKKIELICGNNEDGEVFIKLSNTYSEAIHMASGRIVSIKSDKEFHGFGLENVYDCVDKYDGVIDIYNINEVFYVEIMLKDIERNSLNEDCSC